MDPSARVWGLLGLAPFFAPLLVPALAPALRPGADVGQRLYAALILSFIAGAWFGRALDTENPRVIALSMAPPVLALGLVWPGLLPGQAARLGLILLLAFAALRDRRDPQAPAGYPALRSILTLAAMTALMMGLWVFA